MPPASPVPGCSSGDVCTDRVAIRRGVGQLATFVPSWKRPNVTSNRYIAVHLPQRPLLNPCSRSGVTHVSLGQNLAVRHIGAVTRGTTSPNRLRRVDNF